jgi:hypothetical protein
MCKPDVLEEEFPREPETRFPGKVHRDRTGRDAARTSFLERAVSELGRPPIEASGTGKNKGRAPKGPAFINVSGGYFPAELLFCHRFHQ